MKRVELRQVPDCAGCGACCGSIGLPPFECPNPDLGTVGMPVATGLNLEAVGFDAALFEAMPAALRVEHAALVSALDADPSGKPCAWLDPATKRCRHYDWRPLNCRRWRAGSDECHAMRANPAQECHWGPDNRPERWRNPLLPQEHTPPAPALPV